MITWWKRTVAAAVLAVPPMIAGSPATAGPPACAAPTPSTTKPGYLVADPDCDADGSPFVPLTDASGAPATRTYTGIRDGAAYRIEVPLRWNGQLVVYAHGYRGQGTTVYVDSPGLRAHYIAAGFAWTASSYATNGYDVGQGVRDSYPLIDLFRQVGADAQTGRRAGLDHGSARVPDQHRGQSGRCRSGEEGEQGFGGFALDNDLGHALPQPGDLIFSRTFQEGPEGRVGHLGGHLARR